MNITSRGKIKITASLLFIYVILFEFILPVNQILPRPTLLWDSFFALWSDYNLLPYMAVTTTVVYLTLIAGYIFVDLLSNIFTNLFLKYPAIMIFPALFKYFPAFVFTVISYFWFSESLSGEFIFAIFISLFFILNILNKEIHSVPQHYIESGVSLGLKKKDLYKKLIWKYSQAEIFIQLKRLHYYLWSFVLLFEFIGGSGGIGSIFHLTVKYDDLSAVILLGFIVYLLIWIGDLIIDIIRKRFIFWQKDS